MKWNEGAQGTHLELLSPDPAKALCMIFLCFLITMQLIGVYVSTVGHIYRLESKGPDMPKVYGDAVGNYAII